MKISTRKTNKRIEHEERVRNAVDSYSFTLFRGTQGWYREDNFKTIEEAIETANKAISNKELNPGFRPANIYGIASEMHQHFILIGTVYLNKGYVPAISK